MKQRLIFYDVPDLIAEAREMPTVCGRHVCAAETIHLFADLLEDAMAEIKRLEAVARDQSGAAESGKEA